MLFWWAYLSKKSPLVAGLFLALFAFAKPDLLLPGTLMALFLIYQNRKNRPMIVGVTVSFLILLLIGSLGKNYDRSYFSFCQHYAFLVYPHQLTQVGNRWDNCTAYLQAGFGQAKTIPQVILGNPANYMDFVFLSLSFSIRETLWALLFPLIIIAVCLFSVVWKYKRDLSVFAALQTINIIPIIALSFLHQRYQARFYPLALVIIFTGMELSKGNTIIKVKLGITAILYVAIILWAVFSINGYWFN
jgi:hypothetical protein